MAYDLLLKDQGGRLRHRERAESLALALARLDTVGGLCEVHSAYSEPDDLDVEILAELLEEEAKATSHFNQFCLARGVDPEQAKATADVAADFLDTYWGPSLASAKLPSGREDVTSAYAAIIAFAKEHGLRVCDPQSGRDVDLDRPGTLPAMWE